MSAPVSLAHRAEANDLTVEQAELMAHAITVEQAIHLLLRRIDAAKIASMRPLIRGRDDLAVGMMLVKRAIGRKDDFF
jgi:uncharacterized circularly permuted ATP-grasp superfamily protein